MKQSRIVWTHFYCSRVDYCATSKSGIILFRLAVFELLGKTTRHQRDANDDKRLNCYLV